MSLSAADRRTATVSLGRFSRRERQRTFYSKTDIPVADSTLRGLAERARSELITRIDAVGDLARRAGRRGRVTALAAGSYHVVHHVEGLGGPPVVVRSTLDGLFAVDEGLRFDDCARKWLAGAGSAGLIPETFAVGFKSEGAPFDFAISAVADGIPLRDLGDDALDTAPALLEAVGQALKSVHAVTGQGAGLLACAADALPDVPSGVHADWRDYVLVRLEDHVGACGDAGLLDRSQRGRIMHVFDLLEPLLNERPRRLLHGDPGVHNFCIDPQAKKVTSLFDWEDSLVGDPLFDIAMVATFQPERRLHAFLRGYGFEPANRIDQALLALYFLRIALAKTVHRMRFGIADRPGRTPGHHRLYRGIESVERAIGA